MPRFFVEPLNGDRAVITGQDAHHITRVLRMRVGEPLMLCDGEGTDYRCEIAEFSGDAVQLRVLESEPSQAEPSVAITLYQGLPKSEKMDFIVQKAVELGAVRIVPVAMARSIVKLKADEGAKKQQRWQKIAAEAAGQSGRGRIPQVSEPLSFKQVLAELREVPAIAFYEGGGQPLSALVDREGSSLAVMIGPEGGFDQAEIDQLRQNGVAVATLGKRILRCETAPVAALAILMQLTGNME